MKKVQKENTGATSESKVLQKKDSQIIPKLSNQENENPNDELMQVIHAMIDKLVNLNLAEWHKITLQDSRKGIAIFFPVDKWELVDNELIQIKKK